MAKILTLFNHKGGVGKTTLAYNIAWGLATAGKKVLMVDADAQCNLTEIVVKEKDLDDFFLENNIYNYLYAYIYPDLDRGHPNTKFFEKKENLHLLAGSIRLAELERDIAVALAGDVLKHIPASLYKALQKIAEGFDYIILDLSPALSATNNLLLMLSDYFIIPANPSIFSVQALKNLGIIFRDWNRILASFDIFSRKIKRLPIMLGIVCQNYRPYSKLDEQNTESARRFEDSMNKLNKIALELATDLNSFGMAYTPTEFRGVFENSEPYRIANIPDYNQLKVVSENERMPVNAFNNTILQQNKLATPYYQQKITDFSAECNKIIQGLLKLEHYHA